MPIVTVLAVFRRVHKLTLATTGQQIIDGKEMPERGAQIWWSVQSTRFIPCTCLHPPWRAGHVPTAVVRRGHL